LVNSTANTTAQRKIDLAGNAEIIADGIAQAGTVGNRAAQRVAKEDTASRARLSLKNGVHGRVSIGGIFLPIAFQK